MGAGDARVESDIRAHVNEDHRPEPEAGGEKPRDVAKFVPAGSDLEAHEITDVHVEPRAEIAARHGGDVQRTLEASIAPERRRAKLPQSTVRCRLHRRSLSQPSDERNR